MTSDKRSVQYTYDAFGRLASATDAAGHAEAFARDALGIATNETPTVFDELFWTNRTAVLDRPLDAFGRPAGLVVKIDGDFAQSVCYTYGTDGRMDTITLTNAQGRSVAVGYGWYLSCERSERPSEGAAELAFFWGPDLSGTLQGAGGVGGLVAVSIDGDYYFPGYDNNGNVVGYWDESGSLVAEYAYDAFGNTISSSGSMASIFPHRFSTKYYDAETDLYYYGYRYYSPSLGRWISRDPIEENGANNLFSFCDNNGVRYSDAFGECISVLLLGDSIMFGTPAKDSWGDFVGFSDSIKIDDACIPFMQAGEGGKRIDEIRGLYSSITKTCLDKIVVIAMMGMNDVLQNINRTRLRGRSKQEIEGSIAVRATAMANEWKKLLKRIVSDFPLGKQPNGTDRKGLFVHVTIPTITVTDRTNNNYRDFATFRIQQTIWKANAEMSGKTSAILSKKGWSLAPVSSDGVISHSTDASKDGDLSTIDDGVHFLEPQMKQLGSTISNTINNHTW